MAKLKVTGLDKLFEKEEDSVASSFLTDLERCICLENKEGVREISRTFKPSSMNCERMMYFQVIGVKVPEGYPDPNLVGIQEVGTDRHDRIQKYLDKMKENGIKCKYINVAKYIKKFNLSHLEVVEKKGMEYKLKYPELNLSFMTDGILRYKKEFYILEIKTETIYKHNTRKGVAEEHINQAIAYSIAFGINKVLFLYECRDNSNKKAYIFDVTRRMQEKFLDRIYRVNRAIKKLKPPAKCETEKPCRYCKYTEECSKFN